MRILSVVVLAAACTSSTSDIVTPPPTTPDGIDVLTCNTSLADFCATFGCDQTLVAAVHDKNLCGGLSGWATCGDYQIIYKGYVDAGTEYFYQDGQLVAAEGYGPVGGNTCAGGPQTFNAPYCFSGSETMPQCRAGAL